MTSAEHHGPTLRVYVTIFTSLMVLTALTTYVAFLDLGVLNNIMMLGIAVTKATLVVLYFMHVRYGPRVVQVLAIAGFAWLAVLLVFTLADYLTRGAVLGATLVG
jgi:cytochrome c oxidase subunit 4